MKKLSFVILSVIVLLPLVTITNMARAETNVLLVDETWEFGLKGVLELVDNAHFTVSGPNTASSGETKTFTLFLQTDTTIDDLDQELDGWKVDQMLILVSYDDTAVKMQQGTIQYFDWTAGTNQWETYTPNEGDNQWKKLVMAVGNDLAGAFIPFYGTMSTLAQTIGERQGWLLPEYVSINPNKLSTYFTDDNAYDIERIGVSSSSLYDRWSMNLPLTFTSGGSQGIHLYLKMRLTNIYPDPNWVPKTCETEKEFNFDVDVSGSTIQSTHSGFVISSENSLADETWQIGVNDQGLDLTDSAHLSLRGPSHVCTGDTGNFKIDFQIEPSTKFIEPYGWKVNQMLLLTSYDDTAVEMQQGTMQCRRIDWAQYANHLEYIWSTYGPDEGGELLNKLLMAVSGDLAGSYIPFFDKIPFETLNWLLEYIGASKSWYLPDQVQIDPTTLPPYFADDNIYDIPRIGFTVGDPPSEPSVDRLSMNVPLTFTQNGLQTIHLHLKLRLRVFSNPMFPILCYCETDKEFTFNVQVESPPKPVITSVDFPESICLGSPATVDVTAENQGFTAGWQTIAISFPADQPFPSKLSILQSDLDSYGIHTKGEQISGGYSTKTVTLQTYLIEGASSSWQNDVFHHLKISVTPSQAGPFIFYVKSVAALVDIASRWTPSIPTILDQQEEHVSKYTIYVGGVTNELSDAIVVNKESLLSVSTTGDSRAFHVFTSPVGYLTATEGDTFLIMSTGIAANVPGSPEHFESTDFDGVGTAGDTASLRLSLLVPDGATALSFDFRFMSEEYPEYVGSVFNDFFSAYLTDSAGSRQVAFDDNGHIINVNNNFFNPNIYPIGTVFDGSTKRLTTTVNVNEGEVITLQFVVGDVGDGIYDTAVFLDNVRFNIGGGPGTTPTADVIVVKNSPNSVEQGKQFSYTLNYFNIEEALAKNVVVTDNLPSQVTFASASAGGTYSSMTHSVTWNLGTLQPFSSGSLTLTVSVPNTVPIGTVLQNSASISTTSQESNSNNNQYTKTTTVTAGTSLPPNVEVSPTISNYNGIPVLYWTTPTTFTYHGDVTVIGVDINIHLPDGGLDIGGPMTTTPGTYNWMFTYTFYPRHGQGTVTYTVHYADGHQSITTHSILVDPSGYVYNAITGQRIQGATVTLYRFDIVLQQFVLIAPTDPGIEPHTNPEITDENGGYGWMVSPGMYMVRAEKTGYATNFAIVTVPPSATDLNIPLTPIDANPPTTKILIGGPHYIDAIGNTYVTSATSFTLIADDGPDGSGVAATYYRQYNATHDSNWKEQPNPFYMTGLDDGKYSIDYYSTDVAGNVEPTNTQNITLDNTAPSLTIETPAENDALQDGVTFKVSAWDLSAVASITFSIQCPQGNTISPEFQSMAATLGADGKWSLYFDTRKLPDGFYLFAANGTDVLGNWGTTTVQFSIRNWATIELLPASETNKAGRTMPVKFSIRVKASVDPAQPFIYNEELTIKIYRKGYPGTILQTSKYGTGSTNYRIDPVGEKYITNFKTLSTPATYVVEIYRKGILLGSFEFKTVK